MGKKVGALRDVLCLRDRRRVSVAALQCVTDVELPLAATSVAHFPSFGRTSCALRLPAAAG